MGGQTSFPGLAPTAHAHTAAYTHSPITYGELARSDQRGGQEGCMEREKSRLSLLEILGRTN